MSATALSAHRDRSTGRFAARPPIPVCAECGCTLAEDLAGRYYCPDLVPRANCQAYRVAVDVVPGVQLGVLTAEMLEVDRD